MGKYGEISEMQKQALAVAIFDAQEKLHAWKHAARRLKLIEGELEVRYQTRRVPRIPGCKEWPKNRVIFI